jgi:hypothetical protein
MRLPDSSQHLAIVGATGSGKTQAAQWHLSQRDINTRPWVIYNYKRDRSIDAIPYAKDIDLDEIPIKPGIYIAHPQPDQTDAVEAHMGAIWEKEGIGVYVDEGYMVGDRNPAFRNLLTQGRSKEIPVIVLSQRPVWMDRFVFSEASFYQVFRLNHRKDRRNVEEFVPADLDYRLPDFHSYYYDVGQNRVTILKPVPSIAQIHKTFEARLKHLRQTI